VKLEGPATMSGALGDDGKPVLVDVSLGFSSGVALDIAAGADLVVAYTEAVMGGGTPAGVLPYRGGVRMVRYLDEVFET